MKYIMRLDDACDKRDIEKWDRMELLLDKYSIKPLVGVIPNCEDEAMSEYSVDSNFWNRVETWLKKEWVVAMHGYNHVYITNSGGINPVNKRSEFAGVSLEEQKKKIRDGVEIMRSHNINPLVFFAPSHTFDENTLIALQSESDIRIISDTIATKPYFYKNFTFVPQQSGRVRKLFFNTVTFCYHPNVMTEKDFDYLENFLITYSNKFVAFPIEKATKTRNLFDRFLNYLYMRKHR